jgi:hypothetical protein
MTNSQNQNPYQQPPQSQQQNYQPQYPPQQSQSQQSYQPYGVPQTPPPQMPQVQFAQMKPQPVNGVYPVSENDRQLRLIAFIFMLISTIGMSLTFVALLWMIPMTIMCWNIYKGKKPNGVAFGVCTLVFVSIISGICLLVSTKEK